MLQPKAGYIDARPLTAELVELSCNARPDHTSGSFAPESGWSTWSVDVPIADMPGSAVTFEWKSAAETHQADAVQVSPTRRAMAVAASLTGPHRNAAGCTGVGESPIPAFKASPCP
jgi:hypothetical protein